MVSLNYYGNWLSADFYECEDETVPTRRISSVKRLCRITCSRNEVGMCVPILSLPDHIGEVGNPYKKVLYDIEMVPSGAAVSSLCIYRETRWANRVAR